MKPRFFHYTMEGLYTTGWHLSGSAIKKDFSALEKEMILYYGTNWKDTKRVYKIEPWYPILISFVMNNNLFEFKANTIAEVGAFLRRNRKSIYGIRNMGTSIGAEGYKLDVLFKMHDISWVSRKGDE